MVMMKQLDYLLNSKELGLNRHNIGVIASGYGFEGVPFKEILEQMPDRCEADGVHNAPNSLCDTHSRISPLPDFLPHGIHFLFPIE